MKSMIIAVILGAGAVVHVTTSFERVLGGSDLDRGVYVSPTSDGGYVAVGVTRSFGQGNDDVYLVRTDAAGELLWSRTYGGPQTDNGWAVREHAEQLVIAGFTDSYGAGGFDCYLVGTDLEGEVQWSGTYGGKDKDRCWGFLPAGDGGYVLVGETTSFGRGAEDCYLIKTNASGGEEWSRTFGGQAGDRCFAVAQADDGGFLLAGQTYSEGAGDRDVYLVKTDASGEQLWSKTFGGAASDVGHSVASTADGAFIVTGYTTSLAIEEDDPYLIKIDAAGQLHWTRVIPMDGVNHTLTGEQTVDGGFILGGFSEFRSTGARGAQLVKTDGEGNLEWFRDLLLTTTGATVGYTVRATSDGGAILTGHTTEGSAGDLDLLLVKVDQRGQ
ncbi:MAG: hypothetical protein ABFS14_09580 [Gemmatimonadota bacterium]